MPVNSFPSKLLMKLFKKKIWSHFRGSPGMLVSIVRLNAIARCYSGGWGDRWGFA